MCRFDVFEIWCCREDTVFYVDRLFVVISPCFQILLFQNFLGGVFQLVRHSYVTKQGGWKLDSSTPHETRRLRNFFCDDFLWLRFSLFLRFFFKKIFLVCFQAVNSDSFFFKGYDPFFSVFFCFLLISSFFLLRDGQSRFLFKKI